MNMAKPNFIDTIINFFASLCCPTFGCTQEELDAMMIKKGYRKGYDGSWIMPEDIDPENDTRP